MKTYKLGAYILVLLLIGLLSGCSSDDMTSGAASEDQSIPQAFTSTMDDAVLGRAVKNGILKHDIDKWLKEKDKVIADTEELLQKPELEFVHAELKKAQKINKATRDEFLKNPEKFLAEKYKVEDDGGEMIRTMRATAGGEPQYWTTDKF
ncbi:MAG: hypothetical protein KKB70_07940 [Proteobacteria bacterium]|nr:hypothetical protein [Pseudomonadota bacterium]